MIIAIVGISGVLCPEVEEISKDRKIKEDHKSSSKAHADRVIQNVSKGQDLKLWQLGVVKGVGKHS